MRYLEIIGLFLLITSFLGGCSSVEAAHRFNFRNVDGSITSINTATVEEHTSLLNATVVTVVENSKTKDTVAFVHDGSSIGRATLSTLATMSSIGAGTLLGYYAISP